MSQTDRAMAEKHTILRSVTGSTLYGIALGESGDRDELGICIEPFRDFAGFSEFEQYIYRSAAERTGQHDAPSEAGDLDLTIYSLKKFLRLAMNGNPAVMDLLFVDPLKCVACDARGMQLQELAPLIVSRAAGRRYLGYMESQRQRLLGERGQKKVNRPELEEKYGYDTKYACHILRLGLMGNELLSTGRLTLPMKEADRNYLLDVRRGFLPIQDILQKAGELERDLKDLVHDAPLPEAANREAVEEWMLKAYFENWKAYEVVTEFTATRENLFT